MKCINHPERDAEYICTECSQPLCEECHLDLRGKSICKNCLENVVRKEKEVAKLESNSSVFFHFLCSLIPGAGQMQQGAMRRGMQIMLIFCAMFIISNFVRADELIFFNFAIWFYSFFDSYNIKRSKLQGIVDIDKDFIKREYLDYIEEHINKRYVGWILVGIGLISAIDIICDILVYDMEVQFYAVKVMARAVRECLFPLVVIFFGWQLLRRSKKMNEEIDSPIEENSETEVQ